MSKITLSVPDELYKKIKQYGTKGYGIWSKLFQDAIERFFEIEEYAKNVNVPPEVIQKVISKLESDHEKLSFEFGEDVFFEWIVINGNEKYLFDISEIPEIYIFENLYEKFGDFIGHFEEYEKSFKEEYATTLDRGAFARGFVSAAKIIAKLIRQ